jgi:riboflavin biosynthesis pyrimidine reductase
VRKFVLSMGMSLDGLVARPGRLGAGGWGLGTGDWGLGTARSRSASSGGCAMLTCTSESLIARGELAGEIAALKREPGKDMLAWGGAAFAQSLSRLGLVDEYRLILQPVALGDGLPLFKGLSTPLRLELIDAQTYPTGAALHIYRPAPAAA